MEGAYARSLPLGGCNLFAARISFVDPKQCVLAVEKHGYLEIHAFRD